MTSHIALAPAPPAPAGAIQSVADIVLHRLPAFGARPAIRYDDGAGYQTLDFGDYVTNIRRALGALHGPQAQVVCTFVKNRPEWDMIAFASLYGAHMLFPLDPQMPDEELLHLLRASPPDVVMVSRATRGRMRRLLAELGLAPRLLIADLYRTFEDLDAPTIGDLAEGEGRMSDLPWVVEPAFPPPSPRLADPDTVLGHYATSGTTGLPKVVRITHGNIVSQVNEGIDVMNLRRAEDVLNIGPYTHIATLLEFLVTKTNGFCVTYFTREADEDGVLEAEIRKLKRLGIRIRALMAVPKFWVFLLKEVLEEMKGKAVWRRLYEHLTSIEEHAQLVDLGTVDKAKLNAVRIFLRNKMGGHFSFGITSSTRIDPGVIDIFAKLGVTVIDIYGATEASGIIARNRLNESRRGSCGRLVAGLDYRVENPRRIPGVPHPCGELLVRGPTVARGYVGQPDGAHRDAEGFYHTGDLAWVDAEGWVYLVGRAKELIAWDDGSLIDRMHLSNLLVRSIWVKDALVTRWESENTLSVFLFPDWPRLRKDRDYQAALAAGERPEAALRARLLEAVAYAQRLSGITATLDTGRLYVLSRKLERTPTHKIRFGRELARLDRSAFV